MKQRIILTLAALLCLATAFAGNLLVDNVTLKPGETKDLKISLASTATDLYGVQFDITMPDGFSFESINDQVYRLPTSQPADLTCNVSSLVGNTYRFVLYSSSLQKLKGSELIFLNLKASSTTSLGKYTLNFAGIALSDIDGKVTKESGINATATVTNSFKLSYLVDGEEYKSYDVEFGAAITAEAAPTKEGYTFSGWSEIPETMPAKDVTITGSFAINKYKLSYLVDNEEYKADSLEYGAEITAEAAPTKEGYTFSGWSEIPETMPAKDVTITGSFAINKYKLSYLVDNEEYKADSLEYGAEITAEAAPTKEGYTFSGWSEIPETMPAKDVTITGSFAINKYKLSYLVDNEEYKADSLEYGAEITAEAAPTKEGYTFSGWSEIPETMPAKDVTITGSFAINKYKLSYLVDNEEYKADSLEYGAEITAEAAPTKEGYTFSGWSEIPETMPAKDVTITGSFAINTYTITFVTGEGATVINPITQNYNTEITAPADPERKDYVFDGWDKEIPKKMPAENMTITAIWKEVLITEDSKKTENDETFYNMSDNTAVKIQDNIETDIALTKEAAECATVNSDGGIDFAKGENVNILLKDLSIGRIVIFNITGHIIVDINFLRKKNASSRGTTRGSEYIELESDVEYEVLKNGNIMLTVQLEDTPATINSIKVKSASTGISEVNLSTESESGKWFDLNGHKLDVKPTIPGLYICNGKKIQIKYY